MGWQVIFSLRSRGDLRKIAEYIAKNDPAAAERFGLRLIAQAESLADAPHVGVVMSERPGTRFFPVGPYLVIYRPDQKNQTIRILRFWHSARGRRPLR
jgi:toxin ParE1/3/4